MGSYTNRGYPIGTKSIDSNIADEVSNRLVRAELHRDGVLKTRLD